MFGIKKIREYENLHILMWLLKDTCWVMLWREAGMVMIIPTIAVAIHITWLRRDIIADLFHNLAVCFWISANSIWMIGEFFGWDENLIGPYGLRQFSLIPFILGLSVLFYYYFVLSRQAGFKEKMFSRTDEILKKELSEQ